MKTVFITGANRGIGFEAARQLAERGYFVYLGSRDEEKGRQAKQKLHDLGLDNVDSVVLDVADVDSIRESKQILEAKISHLDVLINNAGIRGDLPQNASNISVDIIRKVFETNVFGPIQIIQAFLPLLRESELPVIVNVTSDLGSLTWRSDPAWAVHKLDRAAYGPSKTALNAYTVALAAEFENSKFKVNCVNPGHTATEFNHFRGTKSVEQGAAVIVRYATLGESGPSGKFFSEEGETPW